MISKSNKLLVDIFTDSNHLEHNLDSFKGVSSALMDSKIQTFKKKKYNIDSSNLWLIYRCHMLKTSVHL